MPMEAWFVLEDNSVADPHEVAPDENGVLTHKSGQKVMMRNPHTPMSRGVDPDAERAKAKNAKTPPKAMESPVNRQMTPETPSRDYKTR